MKKIKLNDRQIIVDKNLVPFIDSSLFQRLKFISQVELANLAYPGASQNRFQHSLGVYGLGKEYLRFLHETSPDERVSDKDAMAFKFACLYHDIGHCAFSHAFDRTIGKTFYGVDKPHDSKRFDIVRNLELEDIDKNIVFDIWNRKHFLSILLNGPISVDRLDFIRRDSIYCGKVEFSTFEPTEIMSYTYLQDKEILYDVRRCQQIEYFLNMRQTMYETVYFHHTSVAGSIVLGMLLDRLSTSHLKLLYVSDFDKITDDFIINMVRFDSKFKKLEPLVNAITTHRHLLPKRQWEIINTPDQGVKLPSLGKDQIIWSSGWLKGFDPSEFENIRFRRRSEIISSHVAFEQFRNIGKPERQITRCYKISPLLNM